MLKNSKVVVVGGSSGIGFAVAQQALNAGAEVVIASRSLEKLHTAAKQLGGNVRVEQVDVSDEQAVIEFFHRVGPFDHLAATIKPQLPSGSFLENDLAAVSAAFDAKFWGSTAWQNMLSAISARTALSSSPQAWPRVAAIRAIRQ